MLKKTLVLLFVCFNVSTSCAQEFKSSISTITTEIFEQMPYSWKDINPVPLADLRCISISHWGFDGQVHQGSLIIHEKVAQEVVEIFNEIFDSHFPIEKMAFVDLYQGDDELSAQANNSYSFCCRPNTSFPNVFSKHSYGLAIDINPLYNPYQKGELIVPKCGAQYLNRESVVKGMIDHESICYQAFFKRGWTWGGDWKEPRGYVDYQHFEKDPKVVLRE